MRWPWGPVQVSPSLGAQPLAEVERARKRAVPVRWDFREAERAVEADGRRHVRERVEQDVAVAGRAGEGDGLLDERPAGSAPASGRADIEPLDFAGPRPVERAHAHASESLPVRVPGEEERAHRPGVAAGQGRDLRRDALNAEVDGQRRLILAKERANFFDVALA